MAYGRIMKSAFIFAALLAMALVSSLGAASAQQAYCPYGQTCQNNNPVPFPVINPLAGLNVLNPTKPQPAPQPIYRATTPTPPPVLPPGR